MKSKADKETLKIQLKRYLITGSEKPSYSPGDRVIEPKFRPKALNSVDELVALDQSSVVVEVIQDAINEPHHDPALLAYLLALCVKSGNEVLRSGAYSSIPSACASSKQLFLFFKFLRDMTEEKKGKCWGAGCKKAVTKWYLSKGDKLAETLVREKQHYGFCHRDLLLQSHFKASTPGVEAIINHFVFGKEATLPETLQKLSSDLKELKTTEDALKAAYLLSHLKLDYSYVPDQFQKSPEMWVDYVKALPTMRLLNKLEYFSASRKLSVAVLPVVTSVLNDSDGSGLDPAEIYVALGNYEVCAKFLRKDRAITKRRAAAAAAAAEEATASAVTKDDKKKNGKVKTVGPKADPIVVAAIKALLQKSLKKLPPGETRWVVGLHLYVGGALEIARLPGVCGAGAAALTLQFLLHVGSVLSVVTTGKNVIKPDKDATVEDVATKLREVRADSDSYCQAIRNAITEKKEVDAFLIISDQKASWSATLAAEVQYLNEYRRALERPLTRLVVIFLGCGREITLPNDPGVLVVKGFDSRVPRLVELYGKSSF